MKSKIFYRGFPNNLRIARRKVDEDETLRKIYSLLEKVKNNKKQQNTYLTDYLNKSNLIGKI